MAFSSITQPVWKTAPFLRLTPPLISGLVFQQWLPVSGYILALAVGFTFAFLYSYEKKITFARYRQPWVRGACLLLLIFFLGRTLNFYQRDPPFSQTQVRPVCLILTVETSPAPKKKSRLAEASLRWLITDTQCRWLTQRVLLYLPVDSLGPPIKAKDQLLCRGSLQPIENNAVSGFDFAAYCARKHIHSQLFLRKNDFKVIGREKDLIFNVLLSIRETIVGIIRHTIFPSHAAGLLEALLIGYTQDLNRSIIADYSSTGVVHIIAISGLHLALIYGLLQFLLQKLRDNGLGGMGKTVLILAFLWLFSLLCGAAPSVLRSALMLTLTLTSGKLGRDISGLNGLSAAAFLLLVYNPAWLSDLGFQLSFLAVLSLLIFARRISNLLSPKNKMLAALWKAAAVSLAAQILTTPICLYYFHQFPVYFLPTNLIAVPLSSLVLMLGIVTCGLAWSRTLSLLAGKICTIAIQLLNGSIRYFSGLPHAVWHTAVFSVGELVSMYLLIWFASQWLLQKKTSWLLLFLMTIVLLLLFNFCGKIGLA